MPKRSNSNNDVKCSFCGKNQKDTKRLVAGPTVYICEGCVNLCNQIIAEEITTVDEELPTGSRIPKPLEIKEYLDEYVIGQEQAKKILSVAVYNHYKRINNTIDNDSDIELAKSNIVLLGPTGAGKTLLAQCLANYLKVPFTIADATSLTEAGYVGEDVENIIQNLLRAADDDTELASRGIVYIDEIDKVTRKSGGSQSSMRDVSGEGVQQALLKIIEGTMSHVSPFGNRANYKQQDMIQVDTTNVLFICGGAFTGLEKIIQRRLGKKGIGFGAQVKDKMKNEEIGEILKHVESEDLVKYGLIPEFVGRVPIIATINDLSESDLIEILEKPRNALIKQYQKLFEFENVILTFTPKSLKAVSKRAKLLKSGARGLRTILENSMLDIMYEIPFKTDLKECIITDDVILNDAAPELVYFKKRRKKSIA